MNMRCTFIYSGLLNFLSAMFCSFHCSFLKFEFFIYQEYQYFICDRCYKSFLPFSVLTLLIVFFARQKFYFLQRNLSFFFVLLDFESQQKSSTTTNLCQNLPIFFVELVWFYFLCWISDIHDIVYVLRYGSDFVFSQMCIQFSGTIY